MASTYTDSIPHRLLRQAQQRPSTAAYAVKVDGQWQPTTYRRFVEEVRAAARALLGLGLPRGGTVALLGCNRPEWVIVDLAAMLAGGAAAGIYTTSSPDEVQYVVHHAEALVVLVEDAAQLAKLEARRAELPLLRWVVLMKGATGTGEGVLTWEQFLARASGVPEADLDRRLEALEPGGLATLIYTSGTTGPPKGVMLSHENLAWTARTLIEVGGAVEGDVSLSYLPLSHIAEQMMTIHIPATAGSTVYFAESADRVPDNLKEVRPTVFLGVPRIWEKLHAALAGRLAEATGVKKRLLSWTRSVCTRVNERRDRGQPLGPTLKAQHQLVDRLVVRRLKAALGFGRARSCISGAAPIAADVLAFFASLDLPVREIYGQSEGSGPTSFNLPGKTRLGSVGQPLGGLQVRIAADGEIQLKGPNVFLGYHKDPAATAEALVDGWLGSGDLGALDAEGFLTITGRKKEIIITAGGKNLAPRNIEAALAQAPLIAEAVVIGDRRPFVTALLTLDESVARKLCPAGELASAPAIRAALQAHVDQVNQTLARVEQVKKFAVLARPFSVDTGELTPTLKLKRRVVAERYASEIDALYAGAGDEPR